MQKIRSAARRHAWYDDPDDNVKTYNVFGRMNSRSKRPIDEENAIAHTQTESDVRTDLEDNRRSRNTEENAPFNHPPKSNTYADGPIAKAPASIETGDISASTEKPSEDSAKLGPPPHEEPEGEIARGVGTNDQPNGLTNRKKGGVRKFFTPFSKKSKDNAAEASRQNTETERAKQPKITILSQARAVFASWINILLVFVPVGIATNYAHVNGVVVFIMNFIAIIPLAAILSFATEELALYIGEVMGGLLNASFGNAVELIVSIIALVQKKILIVQTSLIGSMLSNLLLVMGMCFFFGGINRQEQHFNVTVAQTAASLLALAIFGLIIPTAFQIVSPDDRGVAPISRATGVMLLVVYACYLIFQLRTHVDMYNEPSKKSPKKTHGKKEAGDAARGIAAIGAGGAAYTGGQVNQEQLVQEQPEEKELPQLTRIGALVTLACATVLVALCAEYMVSAIGDVTKNGGVSEEFVGLILLPIVGNAAEHATAVTVAIKDKMDLAIGVAIGSSLQIALLVLPIMVMLNWWTVGSPAVMTLDFDGFQIAVLFISIILVNYLIQDGKSHWLEGVMLEIAYLIIAVSAWYYPATGEVAG